MVLSATCICFSPFLFPEFQLLQLLCPLLSSPEGTFQLRRPSVLTLGFPVLSAAPGRLPFPVCPTRAHPRGPIPAPLPGGDAPELLLPLCGLRPSRLCLALTALTAAFMAFCLCALLHWMRTHWPLHFVPRPSSVCVQGCPNACL